MPHQTCKADPQGAAKTSQLMPGPRPGKATVQRTPGPANRVNHQSSYSERIKPEHGSSPVTQSFGGVAYSSEEGAIRQTGIGWHSRRRRTPRQAPSGRCVHPTPRRAITATCMRRLTGTNYRTTTSRIKTETSKSAPSARTYLRSTQTDRTHRTWPSECAPTHKEGRIRSGTVLRHTYR